MTFQSLRSLSLRVPMAAVAGAMALMVSGAAQAGDDIFEIRPGSFYGAANIGLVEAAGYECQGTAVCEKTKMAGKFFGGWRFTPNLAAEVTYYYLGRFQATNGGNLAATAVASREFKNKGLGVGIDWSGELLGVLTQHIRFGLAHVTTTGSVALGNGTVKEVHEGETKPYVGLGLSYQFNDHVRFYQSYDYLRNKGGEHFHVFSMGLGIEN
jgi:outer membrane autotransporter protein